MIVYVRLMERTLPEYLTCRLREVMTPKKWVQDDHQAVVGDPATVTYESDVHDDHHSPDLDVGGPGTDTKEVSSERVLAVKRSRSAYTGVLTRRLNILNKSIHMSRSANEIQTNIDQVQDALDRLEICHDKLITLYEREGDFEIVIDEELSYNKIKERALNQIDVAKGWLITDMVPVNEKSERNSMKSSRSMSSRKSSFSMKIAAANAAAKRASLEAKARAQEDIFKKIIKMKQLEVEVAKEELEAEIAAATAEEEETSVVHRASQEGLKLSEVKFPPVIKQEHEEPETQQVQSLLNPNAEPWTQTHSLPTTLGHINNNEPLQNNVTTNQQLIEILQLPKVELSSFDGDPLKYWQFVKTFQECVGVTSVGARAKLTRLLQSCTGRAAKAVACCNLMNAEEGYKKALDILQQRFGNELYIKEAWLRKVSDGPNLKASDKLMLSNLADDTRNCVETLKALGHDPDIMSDKVTEVVKRLPFHLQNRWRTEAIKYTERNKRYPGFTPLAEFLERASLEKAKLCFNCLRSNHRVTTCRKATVCEVDNCGMWHHKLLHDAFNKEDTSEKAGKVSTQPKVSTKSCACNPSKDSKIALPIVKVKVGRLGMDNHISTLALLDPGSNSTFCTKALIDKLGISGKSVTLNMTTINKVEDTEVEEITLEMVTGGRKKQTIVLEKVYALKDFPPSLQGGVTSQVDVKKWRHLESLELPNVNAEVVSIVIGQDYPHLLKPQEVRSGKDNEPYAIRTVLGWAINGPVGDDPHSKEVFNNLIHTIPTSESSLSIQVEKFWAIDGCEDLNKNTSCMSKDDKEVLSLWDKSVVKINGHFQLPIPFKRNPPELCNNRSMVDKRQESLKKRLIKNPALLDEYNKEIMKLVTKGQAEVVPDEEIDAFPGLTWYLPIFNVKNEKKPEKFRLVFDCAAEFMGTSLNKHVLQGPDLTNKLFGILQRFRKEKVAIMSDIEAMYYQVKVTPSHRNALRFLWWTDGDLSKDPEIYRMTVHPFGGIWSPSCATYALLHTANDQKDNFDEEEAVNLRRSIASMLKTGGFKLTKWTSNSKHVLQDIPSDEQAKNVKSLDLDEDSLPVEHALGLEWNTINDTLAIRIQEKCRPQTKRGLLSILSSVYDPLGLVSPFILIGKKIFQDECRLQKGWDDHLSEEGMKRWTRWLLDMEHLKDINIERCFKPPGFNEVSYQIHHFSDASEYAYGTVSFLRLVDRNKNIHCAFLAAKSRLAPMKSTTTPRLELAAATTAVKIDEALHQELGLELIESTFWTDSMIVIQYIKNKSKRFKTFVANRVAYIQGSTDIKQWRYIPSKENPADDVSRGLHGEQMKRNQRWLQGPEFLWKPEEEWIPHSDESIDLLVDDIEVKKVPKSIAAVSQVAEDVTDKFLVSFSSWFRLKKAVAWMRRFGQWLKQGKPTTGLEYPITPNNTSSLRVGGRLHQAPVSEETRHPVIVPRQHEIAKLIAKESHETTGHSGREYTMIQRCS
ncbi:uncharacterized protein LOC122263026 [Penaeus japonicus]|uniref:uncharacterized protein LOC122263026 n=1 Tax=Penaeus japonicus TaxID=27405 RepID=UPI001C71522E|nr:uncharacterized protein LOC122263026 [Penaeus japonicus]